MKLICCTVSFFGTQKNFFENCRQVGHASFLRWFTSPAVSLGLKGSQIITLPEVPNSLGPACLSVEKRTPDRLIHDRPRLLKHSINFSGSQRIFSAGILAQILHIFHYNPVCLCSLNRGASIKFMSSQNISVTPTLILSYHLSKFFT